MSRTTTKSQSSTNRINIKEKFPQNRCRMVGARVVCVFVLFFVIANANESLRWCSTRLMIRGRRDLNLKQKYGSSTNNNNIVVVGDMAQGRYRKVQTQQLDSKYFRVVGGSKILWAADEKLRQDSNSVRSKWACVAIWTAQSELRGPTNAKYVYCAPFFLSFFFSRPFIFSAAISRRWFDGVFVCTGVQGLYVCVCVYLLLRCCLRNDIIGLLHYFPTFFFSSSSILVGRVKRRMKKIFWQKVNARKTAIEFARWEFA